MKKWMKADLKYQKMRTKYMNEYNQFAGDDGCGMHENDREFVPGNYSIERVYIVVKSMKAL